MPSTRIGRPGLLGSVERTGVIAGTATMTAKAVNRHSRARQAEQQADEHQPDLVSQLARLAQLRDAGVLTKEEFQQAKAELLCG